MHVLHATLPKEICDFAKSHGPVSLDVSALVEVGAGIALFFAVSVDAPSLWSGAAVCAAHARTKAGTASTAQPNTTSRAGITSLHGACIVPQPALHAPRPKCAFARRHEARLSRTGALTAARLRPVPLRTVFYTPPAR